MVVDLSAMLLLLLLCVTSLMLVTPAEGRYVVLCPTRTFYNEKTEHCTPCSRCPLNQVIVSPCKGTNDARCYPLRYRELEALYQNAAKRDEFIAQLVHNGTAKVGENREKIEDYPPRLEFARDGDSESTRDTAEAGDSEPEFLVYDWKSLTLFAGVALGIVLVVLVVGIVCIRQKLLKLKHSYKLTPPVEL